MKGFNSFSGLHYKYINQADLKNLQMHEYFIKQWVQQEAGKF